MEQMGQQLYDGRIEAAPLVSGRSPCLSCDYSLICTIDRCGGAGSWRHPKSPFEPEKKRRKKHEQPPQKWTPAACAAIAEPGPFAAGQRRSGSGEPAVLTERAVQLITDPEPPSRC